ncbi:MAG: branched-chain amino acid ABC transporter permease, partial [Candidatus Nanopelagicales bacterium]
MSQLLQLLASGVSLGAVYALLALGFVVVYKASGVVNFAHPALLMAGAYVTARLSGAGDVPFYAAVLIGIGGAALISLVIQFFLVAPVAKRSVIAASILTIGVDVVLQTEINR